MTNAGVELPRIFYGCAFVDIPAVEGLEPVKLSRRPEPRRITNLSDTPPPEGTPSMDPENLARLAALRVLNAEAADGLGSEDAAELAALEAEASEAGVTDEEVEAARVPDPEGDPNGEPAGDPDPDPDLDPDPAGPAASPAPSPADDPAPPATPDPAPAGEREEAGELARLRADVARLRAEATERRVETYRTRGAIVEGNQEAALALLGHTDPEVVRHAGSLLDNLATRIQLDVSRGTTSLSSGSSASPAGDQVIRVDMSNDEVSAVWRELTPEQRAERQHELDARRRYRDENGIRD